MSVDIEILIAILADHSELLITQLRAYHQVVGNYKVVVLIPIDDHVFQVLRRSHILCCCYTIG